jgi:hypothetical protein
MASPRISALGQKPTWAAQKGMSALHLKATVKADIRNGSCLLAKGHKHAVHQLMSADIRKPAEDWHD